MKYLKQLFGLLLVLFSIFIDNTVLSNNFIHKTFYANDLTVMLIIRIIVSIIGLGMVFYDFLKPIIEKHYSNRPFEHRIMLLALGIILIFWIIYPFSLGSEIFRHTFDLDAERNAPAWYSTILLAIGGFIALVISQKDKDNLWKILTCLLFFLSLDEMISIHESLVRRVETSWILIAAPLGILLIYWMMWHVRKSKDKIMFYKIILGLSLIGIGAVGLEIIGFSLPFNTTPYYIEVLIEEALEVIGEIVILTALIGYMRKSTILSIE